MKRVRAKTGTFKSISVQVLIVAVLSSLILAVMTGCLLHGQNANVNVTRETSNRKASQVRESPKTFDYVELLDGKHWFVAESDRVLKTQDRGHTWIQAYRKKAATNAEEQVQGLSFINDQIGFLIVARNVLRTEDAGSTWTTLSSIGSEAEKISIRNCHFMDAMHGWAVGMIWQEGWVNDPKTPRYVGIAFATQDGGYTWQRLNLPEENRSGNVYWGLNDVVFQNAQLGWLVGDRGMIFYTQDGGNTWHRGTCADVDYQRVKFIADQFGWVTYKQGNSSWGISITNDGGRSWKSLDDSFVYGTWPVSAVFVERSYGFATSLKLFRTKSSGRQWEEVAGNANIGESAYAFLGRARDRTLVAIGTKGDALTTLISTNDGATWQLDE